PDEFIASFLNRNYEVFIVDAFRGGESIKSYPPDWRRDIMNVALVPVEKTAFF
ncbi:MAG: hypothetical protein JWQ36_1802, partial [Enterovirga sp.]|nr:hypothetical protein [Enterovirga sp.]